MEDTVTFVFRAGYLAERNGVGCRRAENSLVDIESDASNGAVYFATLPDILDEYAREFTVSKIEVIGPLDGKLPLKIPGQEHPYGMKQRETDYLVEYELPTDGYVPVAEKCRKKEVLIPFAFPSVALLPPAGRLVSCGNGEEILRVQILVTQEVVGAICFGDKHREDTVR